jgi:hypothetical protein
MLTRTTRRLVFYTLILAFLAIGAGAVFYAQGYRVDPDTFSVRKIGAVYVRTFPADTRISVGGISIGRSFALFDTGVFVSNLFPKQYEVVAERDGYLSWRQDVSVEPSRVTQLKYVVLVPERPFTITDDGAAEFRMIGQSPLIRTTSGTLAWSGARLPGNRVEGWTNDGNRLLTRNDRTGEYFWTDLGSGSSTALNPLLSRAGIRPDRSVVLPDPENSSRLILHAPGGLWSYELQANRLTRIATTTIPALTPERLARSRSRFAWTAYTTSTKSSVLYLANAGSGAITTSSLAIAAEIRKLAWVADDTLALLSSDDTLHLHRPSAGTLVGRADTVRDFALSEDGGMLAALERQSIEVFSLTGDDYWRLNVPDVAAVTRLTWYRDGRHLFLHYPDRIAFLDLDDRALRNLTTVVRTPYGEYDPEWNVLSYLADASVLGLTFPL